MTNVEQLLQEALTGLADEGRVPSMGERALAGARRRHRRRVVASGVVTIVVLVLASVSVLLLSPGSSRSVGPIAPQDPSERPRIDLPGAMVDRYDALGGRLGTWLLNPDTGRYQLVDRVVVSTAPDLRTAITVADVPCVPQAESPCAAYARYDVATGGVRSLGIDSERYGCVDWSPDGRTVVFCKTTGGQSDPYLEELLFVDIRTGERRSVAPALSIGWLPWDLVGWTADGHHLIIVGKQGRAQRPGADLLYRLDGLPAAVHEWPPGGRTSEVLPVLGTNLIARMPEQGWPGPVEIRDATNGTVVAEHSHEQMLGTGMVADTGDRHAIVPVAWLSEHELVGQGATDDNNDVLVADLASGVVLRWVADIPVDGGLIHVADAG